ncbi:MAG: AAA family ATPase, partial [Bryobacteraceae bacterium]
TPPEILVRCLDYALERQQRQAALRQAGAVNGKLLVFVGAKGGVGTTTVAVNVASAWSRHRSVIIAETESLGCGLASVFRMRPQPCAAWTVDPPDPAAVARHLWRLPSGLRVLPGPPAAVEGDLTPPRAEAVVDALLASAERVIVDLAARASPVHAAVLRRAERIVMVLEREPSSVTAAGRLLEFLRNQCRLEGLVQVVVVNRVPLSCPLPLEEIERELEVRVLGVIPPNPDLCLQARRAGAPVVFFQPESALGASLLELAARLDEEAMAATRAA